MLQTIFRCSLYVSPKTSYGGSTFGLSKVTVGRKIKLARSALEKDFVSKHVNFLPTRENLINESMCQTLFSEDKVVLICDGTYIYINKSRNYEFQKSTYTDQKKRHFVKVIMCVTSNGRMHLGHILLITMMQKF